MKKLFTPALALLFVGMAVFQTSCDKIKEIRFVVPYTISDISVGAQPDNGQIKTWGEEVITQPLENSLNQNGASLDDVEKIQLNSLTVTATAGNFNNWQYAEAFLNATGLPEVKVGFITDIPQNGATTLEMESTFENLAEHLASDEFTFSVRGYNFDPTSPVTMSIDFEVEVIANVEN